jgi:predicted nucleic-acid-binding Zn-ribbon protein
MKGGVRGKYAGRAREGRNIVLIEPEVTDAFPTEQAVNEALKGFTESQTQGGCDMKSGKCPKCQSTDVRIGPPSARARGPMNKMAVSFWRNVVPERHICMSCGYMEQYVADPADRAAIASNWPGGSGGSTA